MKNRLNEKSALLLSVIGFVVSLFVAGVLPAAQAGADPAVSYYGYMEIMPNPNPAIAGENTHISVTVSNQGAAAATNVAVQLSFNDWGVTFMGWQPIGVETVASIAPGGTAVVEFDYVFATRAHTCLEALILSADENDNLANDRGQINMEVINAGETFDYYVPVVNNGDVDLLLHIQGECAGRGPDGGDVPARCQPVQDDVFVPAGEAVMVPVQVEFFPGTPRGTAVDVIVNAMDMQNPGDARTMNHVVVRTVFNTARGLKQDAVALLTALPPLPPPQGNRIRTVIRHIESSLAPELWQDDFRLVSRRAARVYARDMAAVIQALNLIDRGRLPLDWKIQLDGAVRALADADRIIAQTWIQDTGGNPEAEARLLEGDAQRLAGEYDAAIRNWGHVIIMK